MIVMDMLVTEVYVVYVCVWLDKALVVTYVFKRKGLFIPYFPLI